MAIDKRGQGLPVNLIVILIIGIIILLLVVAFATGSISKLFGGAKNIGEAVTPDQVATFRIGCAQACFSAQQLADTQGEWTSSSYCTKELPNGTDTAIKCWDAGTECSKNVTISGVEYMFNATSSAGNVVGCP
jgi:hypothetical protein